MIRPAAPAPAAASPPGREVRLSLPRPRAYLLEERPPSDPRGGLLGRHLAAHRATVPRVDPLDVPAAGTPRERLAEAVPLIGQRLRLDRPLGWQREGLEDRCGGEVGNGEPVADEVLAVPELSLEPVQTLHSPAARLLATLL